MEEEQAREAAKPVPFVKWMSSTFALAVQQQQNPSSPPSMGNRGVCELYYYKMQLVNFGISTMTTKRRKNGYSIRNDMMVDLFSELLILKTESLFKPKLILPILFRIRNRNFID